MPADPVMIKTIVTTDMAKAVAAAYGVKLIEVLTGFKYIGQQILNFETSGRGTYLFGFEESYGYLPGTYARDKDAVAGCLFAAEAAAHYAALGKTLFEALDDIYKKYGYHNEMQVSINLKGESGLRMIRKIMDTVREANGKFLAAVPAEYTDIQSSEVIKFNKDGSIASKEKTTLPSSNVLTFNYGDRWFCLRPSGTEPKIKIYLSAKGDGQAASEEIVGKLEAAIKPLLGI